MNTPRLHFHQNGMHLRCFPQVFPLCSLDMGYPNREYLVYTTYIITDIIRRMLTYRCSFLRHLHNLHTHYIQTDMHISYAHSFYACVCVSIWILCIIAFEMKSRDIEHARYMLLFKSVIDIKIDKIEYLLDQDLF